MRVGPNGTGATRVRGLFRRRRLSLGVIAFGLFVGGATLAGGGHLQRASLPAVEAAMPHAFFRLPTNERVIYLTIDDGPSSDTGAILDLLALYGATATFFVHSDHLPLARDGVLERLKTEGHRLAHHMPADRSYADETDATFAAAFAKTDRALQSFAPAHDRWFRPPLGRIDTKVMSPILEANGYAASERAFVLASFVPWDAGGITETGWDGWDRGFATAYGRQLAEAAFPGAIVIFHDGPRERRVAMTLRSLGVFLARADARGFSVRALPGPGQAAP